MRAGVVVYRAVSGTPVEEEGALLHIASPFAPFMHIKYQATFILFVQNNNALTVALKYWVGPLSMRQNYSQVKTRLV